MDASASAHSALIDGIEAMARWQTHHRTLRTRDALMTAGSSRFPTPFSNALVPLGTASAEALLESAEQFFSDRRYVLWTRSDCDRSLEELALERGFLSLGDEPAMVIEAPLPAVPLAPGLSLELVSTPEVLGELVAVCQEAYAEAGLPAAIGAALFAATDAVLASGALLALARLDGVAIGAALSLANPSSGIGGVYWVGTVPSARRLGCAEALTRFVTNGSFDRGVRLVALQASRAGEPIYRRLGYREVLRYSRFLSKRKDG